MERVWSIYSKETAEPQPTPYSEAPHFRYFPEDKRYNPWHFFQTKPDNFSRTVHIHQETPVEITKAFPSYSVEGDTVDLTNEVVSTTNL